MTKTKTDLPFARYARVSRVGAREGEGFISIPEQERKMRALGDAEGVQLTEELFEDKDRSGGNLERAEFQRALSLIRAGKLGGIAVAKLDRFSRNTEDFLITLREIERLGGRLLCGDGAVSLQNGADTFTATIRMAASTFERHQRKEDLANSVRSSIERGHHLAAPFGYRKANGRGSRLIVVREEADVVRLAFETRAGGGSWATVAEAMNATGVLPRPFKRHGKVTQGRWQHKTARQVVHNEVYLGTAYNGQHRTPGAHDAIVTPQLYARARRTRGVKPVGPSEGYLLTGLVRCSGCGYVMVSGATAKGYRYYHCNAKAHATGPCPAPVNVPADALEQLAAERFKADWLGATFDPDAADEQVAGAEAKVESAKERLRGSMRMRGLLGDSASPTEIELADGQLAEDRRALRDAEDELRQAQMTARGADLPPQLDEAAYDDAPIPERRLWHSLTTACVVVRRAERWREPVAGRARIIDRDDAPTDSTRLIPFVAGLRF